jgi:hypothetical protein
MLCAEPSTVVLLFEQPTTWALVLLCVYAVLDVDEAKELFEQTTKIYLAPREPLFYAGGRMRGQDATGHGKHPLHQPLDHGKVKLARLVSCLQQ